MRSNGSVGKVMATQTQGPESKSQPKATEGHRRPATGLWGGVDSGACWLDRLVNEWGTGSVRISVSKPKAESDWGRHLMLISAHHIYAHEWTYTHTQIHRWSPPIFWNWDYRMLVLSLPHVLAEIVIWRKTSLFSCPKVCCMGKAKLKQTLCPLFANFQKGKLVPSISPKGPWAVLFWVYMWLVCPVTWVIT